MQSIKIMIVDDHQMIREGIKSALAGVTDIAVVAEAASAAEALAQIEKHSEVQVVVMDISLGEGESIPSSAQPGTDSSSREKQS